MRQACNGMTQRCPLLFRKAVPICGATPAARGLNVTGRTRAGETAKNKKGGDRIATAALCFGVPRLDAPGP